MHFNTYNAEVLIYCRKTDNQISFSCGCYLDFHDIGDLMRFFENTMDTDAARNLAYDFEMFHGHVDYGLVVMDSTDDNALWRKISTELTVNGYDLSIYNITYALVRVHKDYKPVGYLKLENGTDAYVVLNRTCATRFYDLAELSRLVEKHNDKCNPGAHFKIVTV